MDEKDMARSAADDGAHDLIKESTTRRRRRRQELSVWHPAVPPRMRSNAGLRPAKRRYVSDEPWNPHCYCHGCRASSANRHSPFASCICRGVRHAGATRAGLATIIAAQRARDVATFKRFKE